jgi:AbrB family looped-hinge helix DNA binding protein
METIKVTVSRRGYIVLPASLRREMELKPGTKMLISRYQDKLILKAVPSFTERLSGLTQKTMADTVQDVEAYIDGEREDRNK